MSNSATTAPTRPAPMFAWLGPLSAFAEWGTKAIRAPCAGG